MTVFGYAAETDADKLRDVGCAAVFTEMSALVGLLNQ
jgi:hypothetical protein